jgi:hypothetical protein
MMTDRQSESRVLTLEHSHRDQGEGNSKQAVRPQAASAGTAGAGGPGGRTLALPQSSHALQTHSRWRGAGSRQLEQTTVSVSGRGPSQSTHRHRHQPWSLQAAWNRRASWRCDSPAYSAAWRQSGAAKSSALEVAADANVPLHSDEARSSRSCHFTLMTWLSSPAARNSRLSQWRRRRM